MKCPHVRSLSVVLVAALFLPLVSCFSFSEDGAGSEPAGASAPEIPADVIGALTPLFGATTGYAVPTAAMENLPPNVEPFMALALRQLNAYRTAAGLEPYSYDERLSQMAMAHVRYAMACSRAKLPWGGHFEKPGQPGYSKEGHEAAASSGISSGNSDPSSAFEGLMAGPYHRMQFLRPGENRVGGGFGKWEGQNNSIFLFVTRGAAPAAKVSPASKAPRFILFPPPDSRGIDTSFDGETPDPRPGVNGGGSAQEVVTGYPITISIPYGDVTSFTSAAVSVTERGGKAVDCWVTDPAHPSTGTAPDIYGPGVSAGSAFARNFDAVFIMPKSPLKRGVTYDVDATLLIGSEPIHLAWSFSTSPALVWKVESRPANPWESLAYAARRAQPGDTIQLAKGTYNLTDSAFLGNVRLVGAGPNESRLRVENRSVMPLIVKGAVAVENLSVEHQGQIIYVSGPSTLCLRNVVMKGGDGQSVAIDLERGATLVMDGADFSGFETYFPCYSDETGTGGEPRVFARNVSGLRSGGKLVYGPAAVTGFSRPLNLP